MSNKVYEEKSARAGSGIAALIVLILLALAGIGAIIWGAVLLDAGRGGAFAVVLMVFGIVYTCVSWLPFMGLKLLNPQEALVLTLFGRYIGTLKGEGFFYVNPFVQAVNPAARSDYSTGAEDAKPASVKGISLSGAGLASVSVSLPSKKLSLKVMTLSNNKQKINDALGNPIELGIVVIWRVVNTAKAVFNVDNYKHYLSIQCDSALRNIVRLYPYDVSADGEESSLRGSSREVAEKLKTEIQEKVEVAGLEILEARITHLAYAPEIAAAMLQRQQASAVIDARKMIVDGAVGMVEMALEKLSEKEIVQLDEERKAAMVSNLLVVLCANRDAQPVVNSGSLY